jgi:hypothetical protein
MAEKITLEELLDAMDEVEDGADDEKYTEYYNAFDRLSAEEVLQHMQADFDEEAYQLLKMGIAYCIYDRDWLVRILTHFALKKSQSRKSS